MKGMRPLTERQWEVVSLVDFGDRHIARALGIAVQTVKNHWQNIFDRLELVGDQRRRKVAATVAAQLLSLAG